MTKDAKFSSDKIFRYSLWRIWDDTKPKIAFVGLNPSTADAEIDDRTIVKCTNYTKSWEYGGFYMVNLFAFRATDPYVLYKVQNEKGIESIVGMENDYHLKDAFDKAEKVICAWGNLGSFKDRNKAVLNLIEKPFCLRKNKGGEPAHPLYLSKSLQPISYFSK